MYIISIIYIKGSHRISEWLIFVLFFAGKLQQYEIARVDETFTFTYSNNETDESVWPGEGMHTPVCCNIFKGPSHLNRDALFMAHSASGGYI